MFFTFCKNLFSESATIMNSIGDSKSSGLRPLSFLKNLVMDPLILAADVADCRMARTVEIHFGDNPRSIKRLMRKHQSTVSKAFS